MSQNVVLTPYLALRQQATRLFLLHIVATVVACAQLWKIVSTPCSPRLRTCTLYKIVYNFKIVSETLHSNFGSYFITYSLKKRSFRKPKVGNKLIFLFFVKKWTTFYSDLTYPALRPTQFMCKFQNCTGYFSIAVVLYWYSRKMFMFIFYFSTVIILIKIISYT